MVARFPFPFSKLWFLLSESISIYQHLRTRGNIEDFMITDSILVGLLFWNYFTTVITDPGHPPKNWVSLRGDLEIALA